jgi:septin family protein
MRTQRKPFILVVVGDSASGKTTLLGNLRRVRSLKSWVGIRDMDQDGCPAAGREHWRKYRVEELLDESIAENKKGRGAIMGGWIWPHEVIASPYFKLDLNLHFLFLKNTEVEYRRRLKKRVGRRMTKGEFDAWAENFPAQQQRLENQVRFTTHHTVINTWELSRAAVVKEVLGVISKIAL